MQYFLLNQILPLYNPVGHNNMYLPYIAIFWNFNRLVTLLMSRFEILNITIINYVVWQTLYTIHIEVIFQSSKKLPCPVSGKSQVEVSVNILWKQNKEWQVCFLWVIIIKYLFKLEELNKFMYQSQVYDVGSISTHLHLSL